MLALTQEHVFQGFDAVWYEWERRLSAATQVQSSAKVCLRLCELALRGFYHSCFANMEVAQIAAGVGVLFCHCWTVFQHGLSFFFSMACSGKFHQANEPQLGLQRQVVLVD